MHIYVNVKAIRTHIQENGLKQSVLAKKADMTETALSMVLLGNRKLEAGEYVSLCNALDVPLETFVARKEIA